MRLDGIIFDLDGTLTDTFAACFAAFREALLAVTHRSFTDEEILARFGPSEDGMFQRWMPDRWEACLQLYLASYEREHRRLARVFPGIQAALDTLKARQIPLAVVTGKGAQSAAISLAQLGLDHYFDTVETGSPEGGIKPRCLRRVLTHWGVTPDRVAYLGDVPSDIEASRAVGIIPLAAAWEKRSDAEALRALEPLAVFDTVAQFIAWVERTVEPRLDAPRNPDPSRGGVAD